MELREAIVAKAREYIGTPYSKLDCSAFVRAVYRNFGFEFVRVSASQAKQLYNLGFGVKIDKSMPVSEVIKKLNPGDVVYWGNPNYPTRWLEIHHTGIYSGDGKNIESAGKGVQERSLWETSKWQIVMIADITSLLKYDGETENNESEVEDMIVKGDTRKELVMELQTNLVELGYDLGDFGENKDGIDGYYGTMTFNAVKDFQNDYEVAGIDDTNSGYVTMETAIKIATVKETGDCKVLQTQIDSLARQLEAANVWKTKVKEVVNG